MFAFDAITYKEADYIDSDCTSDSFIGNVILYILDDYSVIF